MGLSFLKSCTAPTDDPQHSMLVGDDDKDKRLLKINEFQLCKKGEIVQDKIDIQMRVITTVPYDEEELEGLTSLTTVVEIGESHERDKFTWVEEIDMRAELKAVENEDESDEQEISLVRQKVLDFTFKMSHAKQVIKVEIIANLQSKSSAENKSIYTSFFDFSRLIKKSGSLIKPNQVYAASFDDIQVQCSLQEKLKYGGYRCITMRMHDTKGGDFIENPELTMVICEA